MKRVLMGLMLLSSLFLSNVSYAGYAEGTPFSAGNTNTVPAPDAYGQIVRAFLNELLACEHIIEGVCVVEERYATIPIGDTDANFTADKLVKSGPGYVKDLVCSSAAAATAGTIQVRDSTTAGSGNVLGTIGIAAQAYTNPVVLPLSTPFSVGLFIDYTTTTISCYARHR